LKLIPKQILSEYYCYYSDRTVDDLKTEIQQLFDKTSGWNFSINLKGTFTAENEFKAMPKWQLVQIRGGESNEIASITGKIFQNEFHQTEVDFKVSPNSIIPILFFIFPVIGILALTHQKIGGDKNDAIIVGICFTFLVPTLMLILGYQAKKGLKERFVDTFGLREL
jgi:hypothetical protein